MTNEEKAKELLDTGIICDGKWGECLPDCIKCNKYNYMLMMAQWKDEQFAKKIEEIKKNIILERDNHNPEYYKPRLEVALDWVLRLIDEINKDN